MSREFEITREIDLPAAADDVWTAITADSAAWKSRRVGGRIRRDRRPHGLLPPHARAVPRAFQRVPGDTYVGQPSSGIDVSRSAGDEDAMHTLRAALGVGDGAAVGDPVHAELGAAGSLGGVIDHLTPHFVGVRADDGLLRFFGRNAFGGVVGISAQMFRDLVDAAQAKRT